MIAYLFIEIHLICIILFTYVYLIVRRQLCSGRLSSCINLFIGIGITTSVIEIGASLMKESSLVNHVAVLDGVLIICFVITVQLGYLWMLIAGVLQNSPLISNRSFLIISYIPTAVVTLLICTTPMTRLVFYHQQDGEICLGPLFWIFYVLKYVYYVFVAVMARIDIRKTASAVIKRRCHVIIRCMVFPLIFDLTLLICPGIYLSNIGYALACAYITINLYSHVLELSPVWRKIMDSMGCGMINININTNQIISYNKTAMDILDLPDMKVGNRIDLKRHLTDSQQEADPTDINKEFQGLETGEDRISFFTSLRHGDGTVVPVRASVNRIEDASGERLFVCSLLDETETRKALQSNEFSQKILSAIGKVYFCNYYIDISEDTFTELNSLEFLSLFLGKKGKASEGFRIWREISVLSEYQNDVREFQQLDTLRERMGDKQAISIDFQTKHIGWCRGLFIPVERDESGLVTHVLWVARNINEDMLRLEQSRKYFDLYKRDALTGLYNRYGFNECIEEMIRDDPTGGMALLMLDIDLFKRVNDTYGHQNGDIVLRNVAEMLRFIVGRDGIICRWGGEEFMVLLPAGKDASAIAERLRIAMETMEIELPDARISITVSIGVCIVAKGATSTVEKLVYSTDKCLYAAKHAGRNCIVTDIVAE